MHRTLPNVILGIVGIAPVLISAGCALQQASADEQTTQALARQFVEAIFLQKDTAPTMTFAGPNQTYGHSTATLVDDTISNITAKKCITDPKSVSVGKPGGDVGIPAPSSADTAEGITARTAWTVAPNYQCAAYKAPLHRYSVIWLEKTGDKWGVAKASLNLRNPQGY